MNLEVGAETSHLQSQMHSDYDSVESMLASPLYMRSREDCESSRVPIAPVKPAAIVSSGNEEQGNQFKSSVFKNADPLNLGRSLIEGNKEHLIQPFGADELSSLGKVYSRQCLSSLNTVRLQLWSGILHQYKICSLCLVVITFQFVLYIFAIDFLLVQDHQSRVCLSSSHLARTKGWIVLPQQVSLFHHGRSHILHKFLRLLRKD